MNKNFLFTLIIVLLSFNNNLQAQTHQWGGKVVTKKQYDKLLHKFTEDFIKNYVYDSNQYFSDKILLAKLNAEKAESGLAVLIDLNDNRIVSQSAFSKFGNKYLADYNLLNRPIEPGSLMIPLSAAMIMDNFGVSINDSVDLEKGKTKIDGRMIMDAEQHNKRFASLNTVIAESSNVGIAKMVYNGFKTNNYKLHFQDNVNAYVGRTNNILTEASENLLLPFQAMGYGLLLTPNEIFNFYTRVAKADSSLFNNPSTLTQLQSALQDVCNNGTAKRLFADSKYSFAGKTGTSLVLGKNGYASRQFQSTFIGYSSAQNPKYACMVIIKCKPNAPNHFGASVAGPVFKAIMENILNDDQKSENLNQDVMEIEVPTEYHDELLNNRNHYHHLEDSVSAIYKNDLQSDSTSFSPLNKFYVDGKWESGYDGGIVGYYMSACWKNALPIIKKFIEIDRVTGCSSQQIGNNQTVFHYSCEKYIKTRAIYKNGSPVYKTENIDVYFKN